MTLEEVCDRARQFVAAVESLMEGEAHAAAYCPESMRLAAALGMEAGRVQQIIESFEEAMA